jgi:hypothetical protein
MKTIIEAIKSQDAKALTTLFFKGFKYKIKSQSFVASNNRLDLNFMEACSYDWWSYFKEIDGLYIFNNHRYSPTTGKHQSNMLNLLNRLGVYPTVYINTRENMHSFTLVDVLNTLTAQRKDLLTQLHACKRPVSKKRDFLLSQIEDVEAYIDEVQFKLNHMVEVELNGETNKMTERAYDEWTLQLSTGDFHVHKAVFLSKKLKQIA